MYAIENRKCDKFDRNNLPKASNDLSKRKVACETGNKNKLKECTKSQTSSYSKASGKLKNDKEDDIKSSTSSYPKFTSPVLIPSVSQKRQLSTIPNIGDNILHPELIISPRSGDFINRRGIVSLGRRQKLIIGSIGKDKYNL